MRVRYRKEGRGPLWQFFRDSWGELAWVSLAPHGPQFTVEFPSDWHEHRRAWLHVGIGFVTVGVSVPWGKTVPDEGQCSGPTYGFKFFDDLLWIYYGKGKGRRDDPRIALTMPWGWRHREHLILGEPETHPYRYVLRSGEVQERTATIKVEQRTWLRPWLPWKKVRRYIDVAFNDEVGERSGSWKGGVLGCGFNMNPGETALQALRRMEAERKL